MYIKARAILQSHALALSYQKYLLKVLKQTQLDIKNSKLFDLLKNKARNDDYVDDVAEIVQELKDLLEKRVLEITKDIFSFGNNAVKFAYKQIQQSLFKAPQAENQIYLQRPSRSLEVDIFSSIFNEDLFTLVKSWSQTNARLITSVNETLINDVANIVETGFRNGEPTSFIADKIADKTRSSKKKAMFIARDQLSKLHSDYTLSEFRKYNINLYEWSTSNDDAVRHSHKVLNHKICNVDNEKVYKNNADDKGWMHRSSIGGVELPPGQDYQCRCVMIPLIKI